MEIKGRNYLFQKIREFNQRRQAHQKIIQELISPNEHTQTHSSSRQIIQLSPQPIIHHHPQQNHSQITNHQPQLTYRSNISNISNISGISKLSRLSRQVNLDAYLYTKQNYSQKVEQNYEGYKLKISIQERYRNRGIVIRPDNRMIRNTVLVSQNMMDFLIIANYLQQNHLWQEIFEQKQHQYYANLSPEFSPNNIGSICLSKQQLLAQESELVIDSSVHYTENLEKSSYDYDDDEEDSGESREDTVCIGYLLLYRLISYIGTGYAPYLFQVIFGFPYKVYHLHNTPSYLQLIKTLPSITKSHIILTQSTLNQKISPLKPQNLTQKNLPSLLKKHKQIILINCLKQICSKQISIIQRRNHHSVLDIQNQSDEGIQIFVTFVLGLNQEGYGVRFRYCLVGDDGEILEYSQPDQANKQPFTLKLASRTDYKLYISNTTPQQPTQTQTQTPSLLKYTLILQSKKILSNLHTSIKFNESYNIMTQILINRYLTDFVNMDQIQKEMVRLSHIGWKSQLLIVRVWLGFMGLAVDFIAVQDFRGRKSRVMENDVEMDRGNRSRLKIRDRQKQKITKFQVEYCDKQVLCDRQYRQNKKKITNTQPQIHQIYLSKDSKIKSCSGLTFTTSQLVL